MTDTSGCTSTRLDGGASTPIFYREFLAEREEILKHKWVLSEHAGHDVGLDFALIDWVIYHRQAWIKARASRLVSYN